MQDLITWLERMWAAGGTDMAIAATVMTVIAIFLIAWLILPFALIGVKGKIAQLTRATNFNTAEIRALRNENSKRAKRAERRAEIER
ncbi:MAG: hypothetical protein JJ850_03305 [Kordiimonadaceae bacterium]|nr:hypothetical protein [Kordiimonadaceae bacterium]MBO6567163.1 hypothetical protein [Kordiimonadaceae bacterium]MBO6963622.1 hypothetical protein [Kordiimonadaceae bacterium]